MRFFASISSSTARDFGPAPQPFMDAMQRYITDNLASGVLVETAGLAPHRAASIVRSTGGKVQVTDGPFAEAKEVIGGYAVLETPTREAAVGHVRRFMQLHADHWPAWEGECDVREMVFIATQ